MTLELYPGGPNFPALRGPQIAYDDDMRALEAENPEHTATEYGAKWATSRLAYLNPDDVEAIFTPPTGLLVMQHLGMIGIDYHAHADPSRVHKNFAVVIAHATPSDDEYPVPFMDVDYIHVWKPTDFPDKKINYMTVERDLAGLTDRFGMSLFTLDQWNSAGTIDRLQDHANTSPRPRRLTVEEVTATRALNMKMAETLKTAIGMRRVRSPQHELARLELLYLQDFVTHVDHPSTGPVQTSDIYDCFANVNYRLLGPHINQRLSNFKPTIAAGSGSDNTNPYAEQFTDFERAAANRLTQAQARRRYPASNPKYRY